MDVVVRKIVTDAVKLYCDFKSLRKLKLIKAQIRSLEPCDARGIIEDVVDSYLLSRNLSDKEKK